MINFAKDLLISHFLKKDYFFVSSSACLCVHKLKLSNLKNPSLSKYGKQNGAELGQAQLKLGLDFENLLSLNPALKWKKNHPMVPPLDHFQGKNKNCSSLATTIYMSRRSFFANITNKISLLKIAILFSLGSSLTLNLVSTTTHHNKLF